MPTKRVSILERPKNVLGVEPEILSDDDAAKALEELSFLKARKQTLQSLCKERVDQVTADYAAQMVISIDGEEVRLADREAALRAEMERYAEEHRPALLEGKKKSREFSGGHVIGWRVQPEKIVCREGESSRSVVGTVVQAIDGFKKKCVDFLDGLRLWGRGSKARYASQVIVLKAELNLSRISELYQRGDLTVEDLTLLGLEVQEEQDSFYIKLAEYSAQSERTG